MDRAQSDMIIDKYSKMVYRIALHQLKNRTDADDVFQEVFLRYFKKKRSFNSDEHEKAWFIRVTVNCCKSFYRFRLNITDVSGSEKSSVFSLPEENLVHNAVLSLSPKYRSVVVLYYFEEMSAAEIAVVLKITPQAVRTRLSRGRKLLKKILEDGFGNV